MEPQTEVLRKSASEWNLAGDKQLLQILEQMHQKIISKCQEVNTKLDEMANKLDNASVNMQNVNNKFMALSNSQFIESRVYDDDILSEEDNVKKTEVPAEQESDMSKIKRSLQTFEKMHEAVRILDSDSSDEEDDIRTILKLKAVYSERPLPHIIGSYDWRSKWHVGLVPSDSESDDSAEFSKCQAPREQYSESEPEDERADETSHQVAARRVSSSTSVESASPARPADIAAHIAKRLGAQKPPEEAEPREMPVPETAPRKVYRADQPSATIFSEEPPPLDDTIDDYSEEYSGDDDIFAELHKKPISRQRERPGVVDDPFADQLFGDDNRHEELQNEYKASTSKAKETTLYNDDLKSHTHQQKEVVESKSQPDPQERTAKKPIGGMSLFGSSQGAESIGAAILKRNQRKSSLEEDMNDVEEKKQSTNLNKGMTSTNKIIEDLFSKPTPTKEETGKVASKVHNQAKDTKPKVDLFSDNIFDDIDDIFTTEIVIKPKQSHQKSIFDEDELFAEIPTKTSVSVKNKKSLFDSDDELFKDDLVGCVNISKNTREFTSKEVVISKINEPIKEQSNETTIFSDDSDDIFSSNNNTPSSQTQTTSNIDVHDTPPKGDDKITPNIQKDNIKKDEIEQVSKMPLTKTEKEFFSESKLQVIPGPLKQFESPLLFGEDEIDDLFINKSKQSESTREIARDDILTQVNIDTQEESFNDYYAEKEGMKYISEDTLDLKKFEKLKTKSNNFSDQNFEEENKNIKKSAIPNVEPLLVKTTLPDSPVLEPTDITIGNNTNLGSVDRNVITESFSSKIKPDDIQNVIDDIFSDIPPAFEKPSEPKKSKNVNALFDDDSDDENLFFKKNEVHEDKPEAMYNDDRFRIFHDEPPDIDVDFSQKCSDNKIENTDSDDDLFTLPKVRENNESASLYSSHKHEQKDVHFPDFVEAEEETKKSRNTNVDLSNTLGNINVDSNSNKSENETTESKKGEAGNCSPKTDNMDMEREKKSIGKLKPMNININVNSLLPGALPIKQKTKHRTDGSGYSTKSNEEISKGSSQKPELVMVKSVSFDGDPGSEILDNKFSKERAKIQIKRRPSSRRARLEAVRKSGISFSEDSTDNSSSFDEPKPQTDDQTIYNNEFESKEEVSEITDDKIFINKEFNIEKGDISAIKNTDNLKNIVYTETISKTVYILHDEDIFTDSPTTRTENNKGSLTILDDDDVLFKSTNVSVKNIGESVTEKEIESKTYTDKNSAKHKKDSLIKPRTSIFDDSSDDELFGGNDTGVRSGDNVSNKNEETEVLENKKVMKTVTTGNLFGDDSDDDLFRTAKVSGIKTMKPKEAPTTITEPVTDDPLSLLDDS